MSIVRRVIGGVLSLGGLLLSSGSAWASEFSEGWGPAVGSTLPLLEAPDQTGTVRTLEDLAGEQGLLLFLNRSADW